MRRKVKNEVKDIIEKYDLKCSVKEFRYKANFWHISAHRDLSEDFIKEFKDKVYWKFISQEQKLSESFIRKFQVRLYWVEIVQSQYLSEDFIKEFKYKVDWEEIDRRKKNIFHERKTFVEETQPEGVFRIYQLKNLYNLEEGVPYPP